MDFVRSVFDEEDKRILDAFAKGSKKRLWLMEFPLRDVPLEEAMATQTSDRMPTQFREVPKPARKPRKPKK